MDSESKSGSEAHVPGEPVFLLEVNVIVYLRVEVLLYLFFSVLNSVAISVYLSNHTIYFSFRPLSGMNASQQKQVMYATNIGFGYCRYTL